MRPARTKQRSSTITRNFRGHGPVRNRGQLPASWHQMPTNKRDRHHNLVLDHGAVNRNTEQIPRLFRMMHDLVGIDTVTLKSISFHDTHFLEPFARIY